MRGLIKGKVAVFIDAANLELSAKDRGWRVDYLKLYSWLKTEFDVYFVGFYTARFDTQEHDRFLTFLKKTGYELSTKPLKEIRDRGNIKAHHRKANFDVEIAVDALSKRGLYKNLILFSGDSDFDYLVKYLRKAEKKVVVISLKHHISRELIESADFYMDLKKIRKFIERKQ